MNFGAAFEEAKKGAGMRLPHWAPDVIVRVQYPDEHSKMTAPYLYVESRVGRVPWKETMIELFSQNWEVDNPLKDVKARREENAVFDEILFRLDGEIGFAKGTGMPQFVMGLLQARKVVEDYKNGGEAYRDDDKQG